MIGIIFMGDLKYCPYLKRYEEILEKDSIEYEVLFWNRSNDRYDCENYISYNRYSALKKSKLSKLKEFMFFRKWLIKMLDKKRYEKLIILSTLSGMLIAEKLIREYSGKYLFDIRDYSYERILPFFLEEKRLIEAAALTVISSKGFCSFLPKNKNYILMHNISECRKRESESFRPVNGKMINVVWLGIVRYFEQQKELINSLSRDGRFSLLFYGEGTELEIFKKYVQENSLQNVHFYGSYDNADKAELLKKADIINNCYIVKMGTKYAVSNKFYDGVFYHIPQLVEPGTYKAKLVEEYGVGVALDPKEKSFADRLYGYYIDLNRDEFNTSCIKLKYLLLEEEKYSRKRIQNFLKVGHDFNG